MKAVLKPGGSYSDEPSGFFLEFQFELAIIVKKPQVIEAVSKCFPLIAGSKIKEDDPDMSGLTTGIH